MLLSSSLLASTTDVVALKETDLGVILEEFQMEKTNSPTT